jgi:hypothetical protein
MKRMRLRRTYGCQEYQCLLEITQVPDLLLPDTCGYVFDKRMELFELVFCENRFHNMLVNLLASILAETPLLCCD